MSQPDGTPANTSTQGSTLASTASTQQAQTQSSTTSTASLHQSSATDARRQRLEETLAQLKAERDELLLVRSKEESDAIVKEHIALLTKYNDMKDVGQMLLGLIAEQKGVRVREIMEDYELDQKD